MAAGVVLAQSHAAPATVQGVGTKVELSVDQIFAAYGKSDSPGCALGVIQNGNFVYRKAYGMGSLELGAPLSPQSVFCIGSEPMPEHCLL
jgi:CubicO group peptidase (beta-lactamase class C family)